MWVAQERRSAGVKRALGARGVVHVVFVGEVRAADAYAVWVASFLLMNAHGSLYDM